jgi:3-methylcrotonyl-CoA carboxylase alpha subunit
MRKVLIANRGEIACRIIKSCKRLGLQTVAVYSEADAGARHATDADEMVLIGGPRADESYLNAEKIIAAARQQGAEAIHPGYGFLAESAQFARAVEAAGMRWIGPSPQSIDDMGDKQRARAIAENAGVPVLPGSPRLTPGSAAAAAAEGVGFPLLVKAAAGGGGIGMRRVDRPEDLDAAVEATQALAARAFGDGTVYLERLVPQARHVEVQVFGFGDGHAIHLYERECSIQRRFQKIIEETPPPRVSEPTLAAIRKAAVALAKAQNYAGAGTVEFLVDAETEHFYFLEMNTRIQVEHPVTEMVTGLDLVAMQVAQARGDSLPATTQDDVRSDGHAIECRVYAERPHKNFLPSIGVLSRLTLPVEGDGLRIDIGVREGDRVTQYYDPMIAKVVAHATDRDEAIDKLINALSNFHVEGIETNIVFLTRVLSHERFRGGFSTTGFVDTHRKELLA